MDQEIVTAIPSSRTPVHRGRADPWRPQGRVHRSGRGRLGRPGSRLARSQRRPHLRPAHDGQRRRAELEDCRRVGRRRRAERDRHRGVRHRRIGRRCAGGDRRRADQLHPARRRQPLQRHRRSAATPTRIWPATTSPAPTCRRAGLSVPGHHQGERRLQSGLWRADQARQALVLPVGALALRRQLRGEHVLQPEREQAGPLRLRAIDRTRRSSTRSRPSTRRASPGRRRRSTSSASPTTRRTSAPARRPSARNPAAS